MLSEFPEKGDTIYVVEPLKYVSEAEVIICRGVIKQVFCKVKYTGVNEFFPLNNCFETNEKAFNYFKEQIKFEQERFLSLIESMERSLNVNSNELV